MQAPSRRPFCSERCQRVDLANWLGEGYRIEGPPLESEHPQLQETVDAEGGLVLDDEGSSWN